MEGCLELIHRVPGVTPPLDALQERALIRQAQRGDRAAFEQLVRLYEGGVLRLALQVVRSEDEAKDVYQEAFLKIYRSLGRFRFESRFSTWVYRVVMNVCLDHLRRAGTRREVQAPESEPGQAEFFHTLPEERPALNPERAPRPPPRRAGPGGGGPPGRVFPPPCGKAPPRQPRARPPGPGGAAAHPGRP